LIGITDHVIITIERELLHPYNLQCSLWKGEMIMNYRNLVSRIALFFSMTVITLLFASCRCGLDIFPENSFSPFIGPSGGYVFYENPTWETDGWRYLEAAPSDVIVDPNDSLHIFGYYKVEGTETHIGTNFGIGTGRANTNALVGAMGAAAHDNGSGTTTDYAAKLCDDFTILTVDDWFLPSKDELDLMFLRLHKEGLGGFSGGQYYWSSSEHVSSTVPGKYAWLSLFNPEAGHDDIYTNQRKMVECPRSPDQIPYALIDTTQVSG
jgi:hypothetical protein